MEDLLLRSLSMLVEYVYCMIFLLRNEWLEVE
jgi:hypothetical protein